MNLTNKQEKRISDYLSAVARELGGISEEERKAALYRVRARIREELRQFKKGKPKDADVEAILKRCGSPKKQAQQLTKAKKRSQGTAQAPAIAPQVPRRRIHAPADWSLAPEEGLFLGVCAGLGRQFDLEPLLIRVLVLVTGPIGVTAYLVAYAVLYARSDKEAVPPPSAMGLVTAVASVTLVAVALFVGVQLVAKGLEILYGQYGEGSVFTLGPQWNWLLEGQFGRFVWTVVFACPLAALAALPINEAWARTLRKLSHATVAIYAVWLTYGLACLVVGMALELSSDFDGIDDVIGLVRRYL
jgi:phage shock protein PspC (stress-responsive transcriptional regulator)